MRNTNILFTVLLLAACNTQRVTPEYSEIPLPTAAQTILPTPTATPIPATPTSIPVPLSEQGPWILYTAEIEGISGWRAVIANIDGSGAVEIDVPILQYFPWILDNSVAPHGGYIAIRVLLEEEDYQLWIVKVPDLTIARKIPLYSQSAQLADEEAEPDPNYPSEVFLAPVNSTIFVHGGLHLLVQLTDRVQTFTFMTRKMIQ